MSAQPVNPMEAMPGYRNGRNVTEGYARGYQMQFHGLREQVKKDPLYQAALAIGGPRSVVQEDNRINIFLIIRDYLKNIEFGHIVEYGCYKGGNALFMAYVAQRLHPGMRVIGFDTFEGMPPTDPGIDAHGEGDFSDVNLDELRECAALHKLTNLEFIKGRFEHTAAQALPKIGRIALSHIDCDIYSAVKYSYEISKPYMVSGGYIAFDDAIVSSCLGATEAVEELPIRQDGLHSEQIFPHFVFRAPPQWSQLAVSL